MNSDLLQKYIAGNATKDEKRRVTEWIQASPENKREYMAQRKLYDIALWRTDAETIQPVPRKHFTLRHMSWEVSKVAAIFILAFLGIRYWDLKSAEEEKTSLQSIYVPAGQRAELTLADGTKVWLNSRSTLTFPGEFKGEVRDVKLDGEGYFVVARNENQPFVVETNRYDVRVLGTEFNVTAYAEDSVWETSLLKGSVEIWKPGSDVGTLRLDPNTMVSLKKNKLVKGRIREPDYFLWREGLLCFHNISVRDMMEKLKLYYGVDIVVNNQKLLQNRYTGKFRTKDGVEHVLRVLRLNNAFTYTMNEETNVITIN